MNSFTFGLRPQSLPYRFFCAISFTTHFFLLLPSLFFVVYLYYYCCVFWLHSDSMLLVFSSSLVDSFFPSHLPVDFSFVGERYYIILYLMCLLNSPLFRKDYKIAPRNDIYSTDCVLHGFGCRCCCFYCLCGTHKSKEEKKKKTQRFGHGNMWIECVSIYIIFERNVLPGKSWNLSSWHYYLWMELYEKYTALFIMYTALHIYNIVKGFCGKEIKKVSVRARECVCVIIKKRIPPYDAHKNVAHYVRPKTY